MRDRPTHPTYTRLLDTSKTSGCLGLEKPLYDVNWDQLILSDFSTMGVAEEQFKVPEGVEVETLRGKPSQSNSIKQHTAILY